MTKRLKEYFIVEIEGRKTYTNQRGADYAKREAARLKLKAKIVKRRVKS